MLVLGARSFDSSATADRSTHATRSIATRRRTVGGRHRRAQRRAHRQNPVQSRLDCDPDRDRPVRLAQSTLPQLAGIPVPHYDRSQVRTGIVHFGVGGFHRAHQAMYVDRLLSAGHLDWGICGIGTQPADRRMGDLLKVQDCLYTLVLKHPDGELEGRIVGSLTDFIYAPDDPAAVLARLTDPSVRIVSLTITEGGYQVDPDARSFDPVEPQQLLDLQPGAMPCTALGL